MPEWNPADVVEGTADAAFISDEEGRIVAWNDAARELLGYAASEVLGTPCHEILCGRDVFGNRFCDENCSIHGMASDEESARFFLLDVRCASGRRLTLRVSAVRLRGEAPSQFFLLHLLIPAEPDRSWSGAPLPRASAGEVAGEKAPPLVDEKIRSLTPRELEVLRLLAAGNASQDVANQLLISLTTVRTHVQNILKKLEVHSQLEAVALAFKKGLI